LKHKLLISAQVYFISAVWKNNLLISDAGASDSHHDNSVSVPKDTVINNGSFVETPDKDVILED